jgi:hypothetical protein
MGLLAFYGISGLFIYFVEILSNFMLKKVKQK